METKSEEQRIQDAKEAKEKIQTALEKRGVKSFWAKLIASLIIAGIAIAASFFCASCSVSYTKLPDGTVKATGSIVKPVTVTPQKTAYYSLNDQTRKVA